ncbi:MAG: ATPase [Oscillospiraceae bacterium]|jgi:V/A-type H+-transporting ATPase subunit I|nr:ATPase [Oscillospiraceae bacterium]
MAIEKMSLVQLTGGMEILDETLERCLNVESFHPEQLSAFSGKIHGITQIVQESPYKATLSGMKDLAETAGISLPSWQNSNPFLHRDEIQELLAKCKEEISDTDREKKVLLQEIEKSAAELMQKENARGPNADFEDLFAQSYLVVRFGRMPAENLAKIENHKDNPLFFFSLRAENNYVWGVYFTTQKYRVQVDDFFYSLYFERIHSANHAADRDEIEGFISKFKDELTALAQERNRLQTEIEQSSSALVQIEHLKSLNVSLDDIFACKYVEVRFGRLPVDSFSKLKYYSDRMFFFLQFSEEKDYYWGAYFTTWEHRVEIDELFASLYFERVWIPDSVHGTPEFAKLNITANMEAKKQKLVDVNEQITKLITNNLEAFQRAYMRISFLNDSYDLRKYVVVYQNQFHLVGFLPAKNERAFTEHFAEVAGLAVEFKPPDSDKRLTIPTKLKNIRLLKPFEMFVEMYGTPSYDDIDPTPFVGITYMLLFGIMFGDLGQGVVISLLGFLLWKLKKMEFGRILMRIGASSAAFGLVYGSVFGLEHVLDPFYIKVLGLAGKPVEVMAASTINTLLVTAIGLGVVLIISSMFMNIVLGFKQKNYERAVFSNNGIAGLVFYSSVLIGIIARITSEKNLFTPVYIICFIVIPLLFIFLKHPLGKIAKKSKDIKPEDGIGSFLIEGIFELLEVLLSFVTNTLSFLRVGGFIISHAGMMAVVLTLTEMFRGSTSILVLIIGNLFVMALEGFIVGIQILRLEFYELFSRYFDGQGKPFISLTDKSNS